jgi:predicted Zn finger-like uncharacterized protein
MQANCPHCSHKIVIDDARVPDRPFSVKCPKCQQAVKFPGKTAAPAEGAAADEAPSAPPAQRLGPPPAQPGERALVALPDRALATAVAGMLSRQGYEVDTTQDSEEAARLLEQGVFAAVVTAPVAGAQGRESVYQKACRVGPDMRRGFFLVLVADNLKSGEGTQAFTLQADLTLSTRDAPNADVLYASTFGEKRRLYQVYLDARQRADRQAGY